MDFEIGPFNHNYVGWIFLRNRQFKGIVLTNIVGLSFLSNSVHNL